MHLEIRLPPLSKAYKSKIVGFSIFAGKKISASSKISARLWRLLRPLFSIFFPTMTSYSPGFMKLLWTIFQSILKQVFLTAEHYLSIERGNYSLGNLPTLFLKGIFNHRKVF